MRSRQRPPLGPSYRKLVSAAALSNVADGVFQVALPLLALRLTRSPAAIAGLTFVARLPWLVFGVVAGALADRLDRLRTMIRVDVGRAALIGGLAAIVVVEREELWILYGVALLLGVGETMFDTSAQSLLPSVVPEDELSRANGRLYAVEIGMNQFVGPPAGGLIAGLAVAAAFGVTAGCYAGAAVALALIGGSFRAAREHTPGRITADIADGARFVRGHRVLRALIVMSSVSLFASTAAFALFPVFVVEPGPLGLTELGFGVLLTAAAAGSMISSLVVERIERALGRQRTLFVCIVLDAVAIAVIATANLPVVVAAGVALGFSQVLWQVIVVSLRQRVAPAEMLGRVNGIARTMSMGSMVLGAGAGGVAAELIGVRAVFVAAGALTLLLVLLLPAVRA